MQHLHHIHGKFYLIDHDKALRIQDHKIELKLNREEYRERKRKEKIKHGYEMARRARVTLPIFKCCMKSWWPKKFERKRWSFFRYSGPRRCDEI